MLLKMGQSIVGSVTLVKICNYISAPAIGESVKTCPSARQFSLGLASLSKGDAADPAIVA